MKIKLLVITLFVLHVSLALFHLNHTPMWDDEASVVWFAKNYNKFGAILGYDGTHLFSYRNGQLINNQLEYNNPPLDIYFTSCILRFLGDNDFIIRLCFTVSGIIGLGIFVWCIKLITNKNKVWFAYSAALLLLSVNYLLIESNARYYSLTFLFGSISLLAALKIVENPKAGLVHRIALLVLHLVALYFLFLSHYLAALCWWIMCLFIFYQHKVIHFKETFTRFAVLMNASLFCAAAQYFIAHKALERPDMHNDDSCWRKYVKLIEWLFVDLNSINIIPLWTALVFAYLLVAKRKFFSHDFKKMAGFSLVFLVFAVLCNPQSTSKSNNFDIRYLYIIFPMLYGWIGYLLHLVHNGSKKGKYLSVALATIFINTTLLSAIPSDKPPRWLLPNFIKERVLPFPTAYTVALDYIDKHFKERKKILTLPGYHNTVFFRYVPDKIEITNTLTTNTRLSKQLLDSLDMDCLYIGNCKPDYIFQFGTEESLQDYPVFLQEYQYIDTIPVYAYGVDITRPELYWHSFGPRKIKDTSSEALYIYHN